MNKKIAVTGANGMTGSHTVKLLQREGICVKPLTRREWDLADWKSIDELDYIFNSVEAVFHFGAQITYKSLQNNNQKSQELFDTNVRSCLNLAEWANLRNIPIVFLSSAVVYGNPHLPSITENSPKATNDLGGIYGYSKILAEDIFKYLSDQGLKCVILRPTSLYGLGLPHDKLIQNYLDIASLDGTIEVTGPRNKINFIHAYDVADAALKAYRRKSWGIYNIASDGLSSVLEVAETAISIANKGRIKIIDVANSRYFERFDLNPLLAKEKFAFRSKISLFKGMTMMSRREFLP